VPNEISALGIGSGSAGLAGLGAEAAGATWEYFTSWLVGGAG
jgi:hypothetical protein